MRLYWGSLRPTGAKRSPWVGTCCGRMPPCLRDEAGTSKIYSHYGWTYWPMPFACAGVSSELVEPHLSRTKESSWTRLFFVAKSLSLRLLAHFSVCQQRGASSGWFMLVRVLIVPLATALSALICQRRLLFSWREEWTFWTSNQEVSGQNCPLPLDPGL